jgi:Prokaryotic Cytochrome C oxidase subunit IV
LGSDSALGGASGVAATLTILIAFATAYVMGRDFMELRFAPPALRTVFTVWVGVVAGAAVALVVV